MRKVGDFQKWMEEFRNQMSNEAYNKLHIPILEYAQEDIETLKVATVFIRLFCYYLLTRALLQAEKKKVDAEGAAEEPLQVVSTTLRKNELKSLQKVQYECYAMMRWSIVTHIALSFLSSFTSITSISKLA